jgi:hypothetical protein
MGNLSGITDGGWNADEEAKKGGFDPIPAGDYLVVVTATPIKQSKSSDGKYAAIEYQVVEGPYAGRKFFENLNLWNSNQEAVVIARATLANLQKATRVAKLGDTSELHGIPFVARVALTKRKDTGEDQNVIKKYSPKGANMEPVASGGSKKSPLDD